MSNTASRDASRCAPAGRLPLGWREWRDIRAVAALAKNTGATFASVHGVQLRYAAPVPPPAYGPTPPSTVQGDAGTATSPRPHGSGPITARQRRSARRLSEYREKQLKAQGGAKVRSRITKLLGIALRNFRRARVERVHAEWQRLEAAAAAAAEAAAERERAFRSRCVHTAQVCANLRMLFWRAWAQKPEGRTKRCQSLGEYFSCRDRYISTTVLADSANLALVTKWFPRAVSAIAPRQPRRIPRPPRPHAMVLPLSP